MSMKIGIVGGLSPESTVTYYLHLTRRYAQLFGGSTAPEIVIYSVNLEAYHQYRNQGRWDLITDDLVKAIHHLEGCGVDVALISTNTMHKVFAEVQARCTVKLLSIIDATIAAIQAQGLRKVGLLGTRFTMVDDFFSKELTRHGLDPVTPNAEEVAMIHRIIEDELVKGIFTEASRAQYLAVIQRLIGEGAEGIILGCTEIPLLIQQQHVPVPVFDTATLHAEAVLQYVLPHHTPV